MDIQLFVPTFRIEECLQEIRECLEKGWTGLGFKTIAFEEAWIDYTRLPHAHFVNSCTAALHLAVHVLKHRLNWKEEDEIITTPITFVSTNHAILYEGLKPVFADVDDYLCLDPEDVKKKITSRTRAIMFVGLGGNCGQYDQIVRICRENGLALILDAAHMSGTRLRGKHVGSEADAACFSFHSVKNLPTADGGMICFSNLDDDTTVRKLTWLGINKDTYSRTVGGGAYKWLYEVEYLGFKYHGNSIMAAMALVQLKYLDQDNAYRRQLSEWYTSALNNTTYIKIVPIAPECESSRHLFQVLVNNRDELILALNENSVFPGVHYRDNTDYTLYKYAGGTCPHAREVSRQLLSLPLHLRLTRNDVEKISDLVIKHASKF
jgi:dTDP-4-amino-4,6-dideoxygalactose transaminase